MSRIRVEKQTRAALKAMRRIAAVAPAHTKPLLPKEKDTIIRALQEEVDTLEKILGGLDPQFEIIGSLNRPDRSKPKE